jgi:hypothetical protein
MRSQCRIVLNRCAMIKIVYLPCNRASAMPISFSVSPSRSDVASSYKYVSIYKARREWRTPSMAYTQVASSVFRWGYENRP